MGALDAPFKVVLLFEEIPEAIAVLSKIGTNVDIWCMAPRRDFKCFGVFEVSSLASASVLWGNGVLRSEPK